jgi:hypothetical protein
MLASFLYSIACLLVDLLKAWLSWVLIASVALTVRPSAVKGDPRRRLVNGQRLKWRCRGQGTLVGSSLHSTAKSFRQPGGGRPSRTPRAWALVGQFEQRPLRGAKI